MPKTKPVSLIIEMRVDIPEFAPGPFSEYGTPEWLAECLQDVITAWAARTGGFASGEVRVEEEDGTQEEE